MSIPTSFNPMGTLGAEPVPELADTITVPAQANIVLPMVGIEEFDIEFAFKYLQGERESVVNVLSGIFSLIGYVRNTASIGWVTYRSFSAAANTGPMPTGANVVTINARRKSFTIDTTTGTVTQSVSGDLLNNALVIAVITPTTPERERPIELHNGAFKVRDAEGGLLYDLRFRADVLGLYDMVSHKNYYFNT